MTERGRQQSAQNAGPRNAPSEKRGIEGALLSTGPMTTEDDGTCLPLKQKRETDGEFILRFLVEEREQRSSVNMCEVALKLLQFANCLKISDRWLRGFGDAFVDRYAEDIAGEEGDGAVISILIEFVPEVDVSFA